MTDDNKTAETQAMSAQPNPLEVAMANAAVALREFAAQVAPGDRWRDVCEPVANMLERDLDARRRERQPTPDPSVPAGGNVVDLASRRSR